MKSAEKGTEIAFSTAPIGLGHRYAVTGTRFDTRLSTSFQICKDPDRYAVEEMNIGSDEFREMSRWLNRRQFLWFHAFDECEPETLLPWFRATFTLRKITLGGATVGVQLDMQTDSPFGFGEEIEESVVFTEDSLTKVIEDKNDEIGITWPEMVITVRDDGDLQITNDMTGCRFRVANCTAGEIIKISGDTKIISSGFEFENLLLMPGSEDYSAGKTGTNDEWGFSVNEAGEITISALTDEEG